MRAAFEDAGWIVAGEAENGVLAVQRTKELKPDLAILNISMPLLDGLRALPEILASSPPPKVIIFTLHDSEIFRQRTAEMGAHGFVVKSQPLADLVAEAARVLEAK